MGRDKEMSIYTPEGREMVHSRLGVNLSEMHRLMNRKLHSDDSIEFVVNRIALYCAQYGRCAVTGVRLTAENMHCHHINPSSSSQDGPDDSYDNLILVTEEVHRLIHSTKEETILAYLHLIEKDEQLKKINFLRKKAGNSEIFNVFCGGIQLNFLYSF